MSLAEGAIERQIHPRGEASSALGESNFAPRGVGPGEGKIIQIDLSPAKNEFLFAKGSHVTVRLERGDGDAAISIHGHPGSMVLTYDRASREPGKSAELVLQSDANVVGGRLVDAARAVFADDRGDSLIRYRDGSEKIVTNKLGMSVLLNAGAVVSQTPQRMPEAA